MSATVSSRGICPCCRHEETLLPRPEYTHCTCCGHSWRLPPEVVGSTGYYEALVARNDLQAPWFKQKISDRVTALSTLLVKGERRRVLEIGCAEGELGSAIKARFSVVYDGVELSRDSELAAQKLDRVFNTQASEVTSLPYDLIVSFHVLEHIAQPVWELVCWSRLLTESGKLLIEVPNQSGHPLLDNDYNPEHLHQFTPASLALLLSSCGFTCELISTGHYESPLYPDSIRVIAKPSLSVNRRQEKLLARFHERLVGSFIVYGIGGDFHNYIEPLLDKLDIEALLDSSSIKWGKKFGKHTVAFYDEKLHRGFPILICSLRFGAEIKQLLISSGVGLHRIFELQYVYADD